MDQKFKRSRSKNKKRKIRESGNEITKDQKDQRGSTIRSTQREQRVKFRGSERTIKIEGQEKRNIS